MRKYYLSSEKYHRFAPPFRRIARNYIKPLISPRFGDQNGARTGYSPAIIPPAFRAIQRKIVYKSVPSMLFVATKYTVD